MSWTLHLTYRSGREMTHTCGSKLAAERLAANLLNRHHQIARWTIVEGSAS